MSRSRTRIRIGQSAWLQAVAVAVGVSLTGISLQAEVPGTASLSGTVSSSQPFKAAQVYIRNVDKGIVYMVYTHDGRFRAVALFPGNYEISASTKHLESDAHTLASERRRCGRGQPHDASARWRCATPRDPGRPNRYGWRGGARCIPELRRHLPARRWQGGRRAGVHGVSWRELLPLSSRFRGTVEVAHRSHGRQHTLGHRPHEVRPGVAVLSVLDVPLLPTGQG